MSTLGTYRSFRPLSILVLSLLLMSQLSAQSSNKTIYQELMQDFFEAEASFSRISGKPIQELMPVVALDTSSQRKLQILPPRIKYTLLESRQVERKLEIPMAIEAEETEARKLSHIDTLSV